LNYRHAFHAGNFADVFKHTLLLELLAALTAKPKPLCYLETHAGAGRYRLTGQEAEKTGEFRDGVQRLVASAAPPALFAPYLDLVRSCNPGVAPGSLHHYPGSPWLAARCLRPSDRLVLCELQNAEFAELELEFARDPRVALHRRDGYGALKGLLPPRERRGLILIDPPFESQAREFAAITAALEPALERFPDGTYAIWYPIKLRPPVRPFHRWLSNCGAKRVLAAELLLHPDDSALRLNGCGLALINPPWRIEQRVEPLLRALLELLKQGRGGSQRLIWLGAEA
jgi:23S rRNA (adenine2030-N6)-methyltransferase